MISLDLFAWQYQLKQRTIWRLTFIIHVTCFFLRRQATSTCQTDATFLYFYSPFISVCLIYSLCSLVAFSISTEVSASIPHLIWHPLNKQEIHNTSGQQKLLSLQDNDRKLDWGPHACEGNNTIPDAILWPNNNGNFWVKIGLKLCICERRSLEAKLSEVGVLLQIRQLGEDTSEVV